ncbi:hypothetical protein INT46_003752 [Mucor plumbeus]|uniref:Uncharacterized protein n=1 Tax=Mucor plumbeus TaxID=97098 RepID=A0A8H7QTR4_9FUNG|nr:hypothetical protein INT46_003752 [Mucor plumbeus]
MSYLAKTVNSYWNFDEAIAAKRIEKGNCSLESAFDALRQELNFHNNEKASKWKHDWNTMKNNYLAQLPPPTTESHRTSSSEPSNYATPSSSSTINIGSINHSLNSFNGSVYNSPAPQSSHKKSTQLQNNDKQSFDMNYKRVPPTDSLVIDGKVILEKWVEYQVMVAKKYYQTDLLVETDAQGILALDNILLLKKDQICEDVKNILGIDMIQNLTNHIQKKYRIESETLDVNLERELKLIVKNFGEGKLGSRQASRCIMSLTSENVDTAVGDILIGLRNLCDIQISHSIQRPDFVGRILNNIVWNGPVTVGEVKGEDAKDDIYATLLDLIRIGRFSKQSIDSNFYEGVIGIHAVGLIVTVYYTCLLDSGLYVMIEICTISMPRDATQLRLYVAACEDLLSVHHLYKNHCQLANDIDSLKSNMRAVLAYKNMTSERANGYISKRRRYDRIRHNGITTTKYLINQHRESRQLGGIAAK